MGSHTDKERKICDGRAVIYQRTDVQNTTWHCRIHFPKQPYIRQSLNTTNEKEAERLATKLYEDLRCRFERGLPLKRIKFEEAVAAYLAHLEDEVAGDLAKPKKLADQKAMSRYCLEYFKGRNIDAITTGDINKFREWRRKYWTTGPGSKEDTYKYERQGKIVISKKRTAKEPAVSTNNSENVLLRAVFHYAATNDWITTAQIPVIETKIPHGKKGRDAHRRPGLGRDQVKMLLAVSEKRLQAADKDDRLYHQRAMLHAFTGMMAFAGMRPFEAMKLEWKDISATLKVKGKQYWKIHVSGKSKARWLIPLDGIEDFIDNLICYTRDLRKERDPDCTDEFVADNKPVFVDFDGKRIKSFARGFASLLKEAGLHIDPETKKTRDAYCLRHYYATERLVAGVSVYTLAENMGTSVQMIERHYGHLKPEMAAAELTKSNGT